MRGAADSLSSAAYDGTDAVVTAQAPRSRSTSTDYTVQRPTVDASVLERRSAPCRRSAPPSATSPTRRRSSAATASRSATARTSARASTRRTRAPRSTTPFRLAVRPLGDRPGRGRHRRRDRREGATTRSARRVTHRRPAARPRALRGRRHRPLRHREVARHRDRRGVRPAHRAAAVRQGRAATTRSSSPARSGVPGRRRPQGRRRRRSAPARRCRPPRPRTASRSTGLKQFIGDHQDRPARVRRRGGPRGRVHDLQHALDHRRPAHARVRAAADGRRRAPPGARLGADRGAGPRRSARRSSASPPASASPTGLDAVFGALDLSLPEAGTVFEARTAIVALLVGTLVTLVAGLRAGVAGDASRPRRRAARRRPAARKVRLPGARRARRGVADRPPGRAAVGGSAGRLARRNAMRNPGRTAVTAAR